MSDFFSNLQKLTESTSSFLSEQVQNVHESLTTQAKTAEAEMIKERELIIQENESKKKILEGDNSLPWETKEESLMILSQDLMEQMFTHSTHSISEFSLFLYFLMRRMSFLHFVTFGFSLPLYQSSFHV